MSRTIRASALGVLLLVTVPASAAPIPIVFDDRSSFLDSLTRSITDDFSAYGARREPGTAPVQLTDEQMSAVLGETRFEALTIPSLNLVGDVFGNGDGTSYCAGCNGEFRLWFDETSLTRGRGVFGVGVDIELHTSRRCSIGDICPGDVSLPGTLVVELGNGSLERFLVPLDVGFFGPSPFFFGIVDPRGIVSIRFGEEFPAHSWVIDNLTIGQGRISVPEPGTLGLLASALFGLALSRRARKACPV